MNTQQSIDTRRENELRRERRLNEQKNQAKLRIFRRAMKIAIVIVAIGGGVGLFVWYIAIQPPIAEAEIVSQNGLHWHAKLAIDIDGEKYDIPANIGLGALHSPIHTHDADGVIHMEMQGLVRKSDLRLGRFFTVWQKQFSKDCIFDFCGGVGMKVGGGENNEFEVYEMHDGDKIDIKYAPDTNS